MSGNSFRFGAGPPAPPAATTTRSGPPARRPRAWPESARCPPKRLGRAAPHQGTAGSAQRGDRTPTLNSALGPGYRFTAPRPLPAGPTTPHEVHEPTPRAAARCPPGRCPAESTPPRDEQHRRCQPLAEAQSACWRRRREANQRATADVMPRWIEIRLRSQSVVAIAQAPRSFRRAPARPRRQGARSPAPPTSCSPASESALLPPGEHRERPPAAGAQHRCVGDGERPAAASQPA